MKGIIREKLDFLELWESIKKSKSVVLTLHPNPDADSICSNYVMLRILQKHDIKARLIGGDNFVPENFGYISEFIEQVNNISFDEINFEFDTLLALDIARTERISGALKSGLTGDEPFRVINIDHHLGNNFVPNDKVEVFLDPTMSSTCEFLFRFADANEIPLDENWLRALYAGIWSDTMGFTINTSPWTLLCASRIKAYAQVGSIVMQMQKRWSVDDFFLLSKIIPDYSTHDVAGVSVGILVTEHTEIPFEKLQSFFQTEKSSVIVICVKYDNHFRIGAISWINSEKAVAKKIAELFGGSGHANRAGAKETEIRDPIQMREKILSAVATVLSEI